MLEKKEKILDKCVIFQDYIEYPQSVFRTLKGNA